MERLAQILLARDAGSFELLQVLGLASYSKQGGYTLSSARASYRALREAYVRREAPFVMKRKLLADL